MNNTESVVGPMNSSKNKLNSKIILIFHPNPNAYKKKWEKKKWKNIVFLGAKKFSFSIRKPFGVTHKMLVKSFDQNNS